MDNKIFNVNGRTKQQLELAVKLLLLNEYGENKKVRGWYYSKRKGFVLTWHVEKKSKYFTDRLGNPCEIKDFELVDLLWDWLKSEEAKEVVLEDWDADLEHDGSNELGWRLYVDKWGHVEEENGMTIDHYSIAAFKPAYCWYGK